MQTFRLQYTSNFGKCSAPAHRNTTSVPWPKKHITRYAWFLQPCKLESVCPTSGRREVRTVTDSHVMIFLLVCDRGCLTDRRHQTVHNLSDRDERIQWDVGTPPPTLPLSPHTRLFSVLFCLSAPLSTICSVMFPYSSQTYERLSSSSSNGCLLRAEWGYHIVTHCCNQEDTSLGRNRGRRLLSSELSAC